MSIGLSELLVIIIIIITLFKPEKLSDYAKMAGKFLKNVKQAAKSITDATEPVRDAIQPVSSTRCVCQRFVTIWCRSYGTK